jgi:hypothetical protein
MLGAGIKNCQALSQLRAEETDKNLLVKQLPALLLCISQNPDCSPKFNYKVKKSRAIPVTGFAGP